jgi:hypothetical protein
MSEHNSEQKPARRRRRRWPWIVGAIVLVLVLLVVFLPYLLSTGPGTGIVQSIANGQIRGRLEMDDLSLRWFGPTRVTNLRVIDPQGRVVLADANLYADGGIWWATSEIGDFDNVDVSAGQVVAYFDEQGNVSLAQAFESREEAEEPDEEEPDDEEAKPLRPRGKLTFNAADVRLVSADGREYRITNVDGQAQLDTLADIQGRASATLAGGGRIEADGNVKDLFDRDGKFDMPGANGNVVVKTPQAIELGPLASFMGRGETSGQLSIDLDADFGDGEVDATVSMPVRNLTSPRLRQAGGEPIDVALGGTLRGNRQAMAGQMTVGGDPGRIVATYDYERSEDQPELTAEYITQAILTGRRVGMPSATLTAEGQMDIARLAQAAPALLAIRDDVVLTGGQLTIENFRIAGGESPEIRGAIRLTDLAATIDGRRETFEPITLNTQAALVQDVGLRVASANLDSAFAKLSASGTTRNMTGKFSADLSALRERLTTLLAMDVPAMAGSVAGEMRANSVEGNADEVALVASMNVANFRYAISPDQTLVIARGQANYDGVLEFDEGQPVRAVARQLTAALDNAVAMTAEGNYDLRDGGFEAQLTLDRAQLPWLAQRLSELGMAEQAPELAGNMTANARAQRADSDAAIVTGGSGQVTGVALRGNRLARPVQYEWTNVSYGPAAGDVSIEAAAVRSELASLTASDVRMTGGERPQASAKVELGADLAKLAAFTAARDQQAPQIAGQLAWNGDIGSRGDDITIDGSGAIRDFLAGQGDAAVTEGQVELTQQLSVNTRAQRARVESFRVGSRTLDLRLAGTVTELDSRQVLDLSGHYRASLERLTAILHELRPDTKDTVAFAGTSESDVKISGPLNSPDVQPPFARLQASARGGWESGSVYGMDLGEATLAPRLEGGVLSIPVAAIPANEGTLRLGGRVDLSEPMVYSLAGKQAVLEDVQITPEMAQLLLSRINPIFSNVTAIDGSVSLTTEDLAVPLAAASDKGSGQGRLDLADLRMKPSGLLSRLLQLGGVATGDALLVKTQGVNFAIREGGIAYDDFQMVFAEDFNIIFSGIVRFDDRLDMTARIPLRPALLRQLGVPTVGVDIAGLVDHVDLKIGGTRTDPKITTDLRELARSLIRQSVGGGLRDILRPGRDTQPGQQQVPGTTTEPATQPTTAPKRDDGPGTVLDSLMDILEQRRKNSADKKEGSGG